MGLNKEDKFDLIHTGNLPDCIGLLNILVACVPRLKRFVCVFKAFVINCFSTILNAIHITWKLLFRNFVFDILSILILVYWCEVNML